MQLDAFLNIVGAHWFFKTGMNYPGLTVNLYDEIMSGDASYLTK